jgi:hypothetical protein
MKIDLLEGSMKLVDIYGMEFSLDKNFKTNIVKPEPLASPELSFGGEAVRNALKNNPNDRFLGNCPTLFTLSANNLETYQIRRDFDLQNTLTPANEFTTIMEEKSANDIGCKI